MEGLIIVRIIAIVVFVVTLSFCIGYVRGFKKSKEIDDIIIAELAEKYKHIKEYFQIEVNMSKWISIWVVDNSIQEPIIFDTYNEAYDDMLDDFNRFSIDSTEAKISNLSAYIKNSEHYISWRLYRINF